MSVDKTPSLSASSTAASQAPDSSAAPSPAAPASPGAGSGFPLRPVLALLSSMVILALGTSLAKQLFPVIGAQGTTTLRLGFSALVLMLLWRPWRHRLPRQDWWVILRYGVTLGVMNLMFYMAIRTIPFGIAVAIEFCGPLAVALFSSRRRIDFVWIGCAVVGLLMLLPIWPSGDPAAAQAGAAAASGAAGMASGAGATAGAGEAGNAVATSGVGVSGGALDPMGVLCAIAAATCWGGYIIFGKRTQHLHAGLTVALGVAAGALVVAPVGIVHAGWGLLEPWVLGVGLAAAVMSSAIPMFLEMKALRGLAAGTYGVMTSLEPALTAMIAFVTLGEALTLPQCVAIALTVTAAMGSAMTGQRQA